MSIFDYRASIVISSKDYPFYALVMAAYRQADSTNAKKLEAAFPQVCQELRKRYNAPGGLLDGEAP